jgi:hypothetical protein
VSLGFTEPISPSWVEESKRLLQYHYDQTVLFVVNSPTAALQWPVVSLKHDITTSPIEYHYAMAIVFLQYHDGHQN